MATQVSRAQRLAQADDVVDNGGPRAALAPQVERLDAFYRDCAKRVLERAARSPDNGAQS
jgi:dephospho-CoA kinase